MVLALKSWGFCVLTFSKTSPMMACK
jgi:hypothetical protein